MAWMLNWGILDEHNLTRGSLSPIWESAKKARTEEKFVTRIDLTLIDAWRHAISCSVPCRSRSYCRAGLDVDSRSHGLGQVAQGVNESCTANLTAPRTLPAADTRQLLQPFSATHRIAATTN
jgi:hypothetical protein